MPGREGLVYAGALRELRHIVRGVAQAMPQDKDDMLELHPKLAKMFEELLAGPQGSMLFDGYPRESLQHYVWPKRFIYRKRTMELIFEWEELGTLREIASRDAETLGQAARYEELRAAIIVELLSGARFR